ncbi:MAG: Fic family protein [Propionibacteriaceae bacterium]|nr:Fic family protein [Propionibacteriaceae bacterium]
MAMTGVIFQPPNLDEREQEVIDTIASLRTQLRFNIAEPRRWTGSLRRLSFARNVQGSNSIEGYVASLDDAVAVVDAEAPTDADEQTRRALEGYRTAMTYVLQLCSVPKPFVYSSPLIQALHFMMTSFDLANRPGLWRSGPIYVRNESTNTTVYEGPDVDDVPVLMEHFLETLTATRDDSIVSAAMAHLNLVMIHPFRDGNGRMARGLQSLVLGRSGQTLSPVFLSVEEYLGRNTSAYYDVLAETGAGSWNPSRDTRAWIRFMLTAHLRQARTYQQRVHDYERLWVELARMLGRGDEFRALPSLMDAALGLRVTRATYSKLADDNDDTISDQSATRDLRELVDQGLLVPHGEKRGRYYSGSPTLRAVWGDIVKARPHRDDTDPFAESGGAK